MANDFTFTQISTILNTIYQQVMGSTPMTAIDTSQFVNVATTVLKQGYDPVIGAISQVLGPTIFSHRPYTRKFKVLERTRQQYGNHVRKLQPLDGSWEDDQRYDLTDGASVDMYKVNKPKVLQTNFYGMVTRQRHITLFKDQLDTAFSGPNELGQFVSMIMGNVSDQIEQAHEILSRYVVANYIAGMITLGNANQIIHLVTEFTTERGDETALTWADIVADTALYRAFMEFAFARMETASDYLTERSYLYHQNLSPAGTVQNIPRHTPLARQRALFFGPLLNVIGTRVYANTFHTQFLRMLDHERVNYWQTITSPENINIKPAYTKNDGTIAVADAAVSKGGIFGLLFDEEAMGTTIVNEWTQPTPFNAAGGYTNVFWHFSDKYWNDWTENALLFLLD